MSINRLHPLSFRTVFISDVHLGFRGCAAEYLLDFLNSIECDQLYLVGDIFDIWEMSKKGIYWPKAHNDVVKRVFDMAANGTRVIYIPGNHDEVLREYAGSTFNNVEIKLKAVHETADGRRFLVLHGDEFDTVVQASRFLAKMGSRMYDWLLQANYYVNAIRRFFGAPYWSLAAHVKHKVKNAVNYIGKFEEAVAYEARRQNMDGLICGHIHHAEIADMDGVLYCNDGDWVESCTSLIEHTDGRLEILHWTEEQISLKQIDAHAEQVRAA